MARSAAGIVIAGATSGVGKTTLATGIMGALRRRGLVVQPFKVGPDYIDPSYHTIACGRPSRNLDNWMVPSPVLKELYHRATGGSVGGIVPLQGMDPHPSPLPKGEGERADIAIVEGVMGLFDGRSGADGAGSSAEVAKLLGLPVLLVLDVGKMARSAAAMALGYARFDPEVRVAGVLANNVGSAAHLRIIREAIEGSVGLPVVGHMPRRAELRLPERHLGLIPTAEGRMDVDFLDRLVQLVEENVDLDAVLRLAGEARGARTEAAEPTGGTGAGIFPEAPIETRATIAVARDEAFCFYYQDNLDLLSAWGAKLVAFSPLHDCAPPDGVDGLYIGGGFPELFAADLAANGQMLRSIREVHASGTPIYAECGGLMYLCQSIADAEGHVHGMVGLVPARALMRDRRVNLGYVEVTARRDSAILGEGQTARGHEFHWSSLAPELDEAGAAYEVRGDGRREGYVAGSLLASYVHLHFGSNPGLAPNFVDACARWRAGR